MPTNPSVQDDGRENDIHAHDLQDRDVGEKEKGSMGEKEYGESSCLTKEISNPHTKEDTGTDADIPPHGVGKELWAKLDQGCREWIREYAAYDDTNRPSLSHMKPDTRVRSRKESFCSEPHGPVPNDDTNNEDGYAIDVDTPTAGDTVGTNSREYVPGADG